MAKDQLSIESLGNGRAISKGRNLSVLGTPMTQNLVDENSLPFSVPQKYYPRTSSSLGVAQKNTLRQMTRRPGQQRYYLSPLYEGADLATLLGNNNHLVSTNVLHHARPQPQINMLYLLVYVNAINHGNQGEAPRWDELW